MDDRTNDRRPGGGARAADGDGGHVNNTDRMPNQPDPKRQPAGTPDTPRPYGSAAVDYFKRGWTPLPLPPGQKAPPPPWYTGQGARRPWLADISAWALDRPDANLGLRLPDDIIGIDVDAYAHKHGDQTIADLEKKLGPLPPTMRTTSRLESSRRPGILLYRVPPGHSWRDPGPSVEVVYAGWRYALAWPSIHPEGRPYLWIDDRTGEIVAGVPAPATLPELPPAWVKFLCGRIGTTKADIDDDDADRFIDALPDGEPCRYLTGLLDEFATKLRTGRHPALNDTVGKILRAGEQGHAGARVALNTVTATFTKDAAADPARRPDPKEIQRSVVGAVALIEATPTADTDRGCCGRDGDNHDDLREGMHHGQLRMAYRLVNSHWRTKLLHVHGIGWHWWDGKRWAEDDQGHAIRAVRNVLRKALAASLDMNNEEAAKAIRRDVDKCSSATGTGGVLALAASMAPFAATIRDLDADPYLLNVANGTLDMRTMHLRPHDPKDRITKVATGAYRGDTDPAEWLRFLDRVLPDHEVRKFLQRVAGVALLGRVVEHVLVILTGTGANGKGRCVHAIEHALGDYAAPAEAELFMHREGAHPTGEMDLRGRRWVSVSESDDGRHLAAATMKRLTGGDTIKARRMRQDFVAFEPSHTALLVTNHLPKVRGDDPALWRRIRVVPFDVVIPEDEQDKHLDEKLELHADAVLRWAVTGWADYSRLGDMAEPDAVRVATDAYQQESDPVARFIEDECIPHGQVKAGDLYRRWQAWALADGAPEMTARAFGQALDRKGYKADRTKSARFRLGLTLANPSGEGDG